MVLQIFFYIGFILWVLASIILILVVLVQSGKGGGLSGLVGAGSALGDHLGATGAEKTLNRWTSYCAVGFLVLTIFLVLAGGTIFRGNTALDFDSGKPAQSSQTAPGKAPAAPAQPAEAPAAPAAPAPAGK